MVIAGVVGIGLMWGWLMVLLVDQTMAKRPYINLATVALITIWLGWIIYLLVGSAPLIPFFIAFIISFLIHIAWRTQLRRKQKS
ncbi:hypothetical protein MNBD_CHLOROFLEXI01-4193 [hydrothermal vent metagenome]|uniref:Uncharacterized protein n=1 Tax=hydrothermal vent metagenome TaxID=652676 RepID=A0A3B0VN17_9ZZZZ